MRPERVCALALLTTVTLAHAQWSGWENEFDEEAKSWKEIQAQLPAPPKPDNLLRVEGHIHSGHQFYVDAASISLGEDGVIRYTSIVKAAGGATNVTFEGMRCETRELKVYALGRTDGTWTRAYKPAWRRIVLTQATPHRWTLYREYFCPSPASPTPPKQALQALRSGRPIGAAPTLDQ